MNTPESIKANIAARKALGMTAAEYQAHLQACERADQAERRNAIRMAIAATIKGDDDMADYWHSECVRLGAC
jgi:hypothetical protein